MIGQKTVTRRVIKPPPELEKKNGAPMWFYRGDRYPDIELRKLLANESKFKPNEILWVKSMLYQSRKEACFKLRVVSCLPIRLQEIDDADAYREGFTNRHEFSAYWDYLQEGKGDEFKWLRNPWVWRIEFVRQN